MMIICVRTLQVGYLTNMGRTNSDFGGAPVGKGFFSKVGREKSRVAHVINPQFAQGHNKIERDVDLGKVRKQKFGECAHHHRHLLSNEQTS